MGKLERLMTIPQIAAEHRVAASTLYARAAAIPVVGMGLGTITVYAPHEVRTLLKAGTRGRRKKRSPQRAQRTRR